jgi:cob(I)alamin adenosyltransferase
VAQQIVHEGEYDVVVLDEVLGAVKAGLVPLDELVELARSKPAALHLVLTGRNAPPELVEVADLVSEIQPIKHPLQQGIKAQRGIEF